MELGIKNKIALVTGSSRGIGKSCALSLAKEEVKVVICGRNQNTLNNTLDEIKVLSPQSIAIKSDITNISSLSSLTEEITNKLGPIEILVNNVGGSVKREGVEGTEIKDLNKAFELNIDPTLKLMQLVIPTMKSNNWGRIINIGGLAARSGGAISGLRNLALVHLTKTLSNELGQFGITANIIHPGATRTERTQPMQENIANAQGLTVEDIEKKATQSIDIKRMVEAEEIAYLAVFLCSPRASAITGESIAAGGGVGSAVFS